MVDGPRVAGRGLCSARATGRWRAVSRAGRRVVPLLAIACLRRDVAGAWATKLEGSYVTVCSPSVWHLLGVGIMKEKMIGNL